jgi:FtsZ-binding cell division protein ZapB
LGIDDPWNTLALHLKKERKELTRTVSDAIERRNSIVHKGDRQLESETLEKQTIAFAWTQQAIDTIKHVCLGFDELVADRMNQHREALAARRQEVANG